MIITFIITISLLLSIQFLLEGKRHFRIPDTDKLGDFNYSFKEETLSDRAVKHPFVSNLENIQLTGQLYTDGRFWLMFAIQKDIIWVGRCILIINSLFFAHAYNVFSQSGANSLYINIFVLMCIFQVSYWFYYAKTPIVTLLFDREKQGVYVPPYVENPDIFVPFDKMRFYHPNTWFGKQLVAASSITRKTKKPLKLANDFSEASSFTLYHLPPKVFMRYRYQDCAAVLSAIHLFMGNYESLKEKGVIQQLPNPDTLRNYLK